MFTHTPVKKQGFATKPHHDSMSGTSHPQHPKIRQILRKSSIQPKLTIGAPNDKYEQEADRVADQVMRMRDPSGVDPTHSDSKIQRLCVECEEDIHRQPTENEEEEELLQTKERAGKTPTVTSGVQGQIEALKGAGQPLSHSLRSFYEPRFRHDFSGVRIHTGTNATHTARTLNARAYTIGKDVVFGAGQYDPASSNGKRLLAHELTHVTQQSVPGISKATQISRTIGDGHDLTATRFSENVVLEDVYDGRVELSDALNSTGSAVRLIQQSLLAQGYNLPVHRDDGDFGGETDAAVRQFQIDAGAIKLDGIVGPETMKLLDMHDPGVTAATGPVPGLPPVAGPPATGATFAEHPQEQSAGYDNTTAPNDSLVVPVNGRRQVQVAITPAVTVPAPVPAYASDTPGVATVEPTPDGIAVTGVSDGTAKIESREGATVLDTIDVDVKNRLNRSLAFHYVCDSRLAAAGGPQCSNNTPSAGTMRSLLNRVWERQANVRFTGGTSHNIVAVGDLGAAVDGRTVGPEPEIAAVTAGSAGANYNVFRVWHHLVDGANTNDASNLGSDTIIGDNPCRDGLGLPHEAGHFLGVDHPDGFIMTPCPGARTERINLAIANKVNP